MMEEVEPLWSPAQLEALEVQIEAARGGDIEAAKSLLFMAMRCLQGRMVPPDPLRRYIVDAFEAILRRGPYRPSRTKGVTPADAADLRLMAERDIPATGDANTAFHLKLDPGQRHKGRRAYVSRGLAAAVYRTKGKGNSWERSVGLVADYYKVSRRTVTLAWSEFKDDATFLRSMALRDEAEKEFLAYLEDVRKARGS